jgi:hypothetical protein
MSLRITIAVNNLNSLSKLVCIKKYLFAITISLALVLGTTNSVAQTTFTLVTPTGEGGFEIGPTFGANGWTVVNAPKSAWEIGTGALQYAGSRGVYTIDNTTGTWSYNKGNNRTSHFYRDVAIPAGYTNIILDFYWKGKGESGIDRALVYTAPTSFTPVVNSPASPSTVLTGATLVWTQPSVQATATYTYATITLPNNLAGTTVRIIFTWQNDVSGGTTPGAAIDNISLRCDQPPPCSGAPNAGLAAITPTSGCANRSFTLSATGTSINPGISYQWYSSASSSGPWIAITGATSTSTVISSGVSSTTYYQCVTNCSNGPTSNTTSVTSYSVPLADVCTCITYPSNFATTIDDEDISRVRVGTLDNSSICGTLAPGVGSIQSIYSNYAGIIAAPTFTQNSAVSFSLTQTSCGIFAYNNFFQIYIDYNQNGSFADAGEQVYSQGASVLGNHTALGSFVVPLNAIAGTTRMRVVVIEADIASTALYGQNVPYVWGETEDYCVNIVAPPPPTTAPSCITLPTSPTSGQSGVNPTLVTLSWPPASGATGYNFYFGTSSSPTLVASNYTGSTYTLGSLSNSTTYYWQSVPTNTLGTPASCSVWNFTTGIAGCNSGSLYESYTPTTCIGVEQYYAPCTFAGEYNTLTLAAGTTYTFGTTLATDYITISSGSTFLASGVQPVIYTTTSAGSYTVQINTNNACGTDGICHDPWVKCGPPPIADPTSISVSSSSICAGSTVTLTVNGAVGTVNWFLGTCGTSGAIATGTAITVSPSNSSLYFARNNSGGIWSLGCASASIQVVSNPTVSAGTNTTACVGLTAQLNGSASVLSAANGSLSTTYTGGFYCSGGNMFNITTNTSAITVNGFSITPRVMGTQTVAVYYKLGTVAGSETNSAAWTLLGNYTIFSAASETPMKLNVGNISIPANTIYGIYILYNSVFTNSNLSYSNADITINVARGLCGPFSSVYNNYILNGAVLYEKNVAATPSYTWSPSTYLSAINISNPVSTPSASINYSLSSSLNGCNTASSVSVTVNTPIISPTPTTGDYIWCGNTSSAWSVPGNWYVYSNSTYSLASVATNTNNNVIIAPTGTCITQQPIVSIPGSAQNLTINSGASLTLNSGSSITSKNLTIASTGTLDMNGVGTRTLNISGNWQNNGTFNAGAGTVNFNGTTSQSINKSSGNEVFANVIVNNSGGSLTLTSPVEIGTNISLTSGLVNSDVTNLLIVKDNATATGASNTSHVVGPVRKIGDDVAFTFPIGKGGTYAPAAIGTPTVITDYFTAEYFNSDPNGSYNVNSKDNTINNISACEYWIIDRVGGGSDVTVNLSWDARSCGVNDPTNLLVGRWDGLVWRDHGNGGTTGTNAAGTITTASVVTDFSPFTLASRTGINPLPIELTNFDLSCENEKVSINWSTASEINNDFFTVGRSVDGLNFEPIATIKGNGTTNTKNSYSFTDANPIDGLSYYQLKQTDFNGQTKTYNLKSVDCENKNSEIFIYPNPTNGIFVVQGTTFGCDLIVTDIVGKEIYYTKGSEHKTQVNFNDFSSGIYYITITKGIEKITKKVVID